MLRIIGPIVLLIGVICGIVAVGSFARSFGTMETPTLFIVCGPGILLIPLGLFLTSVGFMGALARYQAGEVAPVAKDTFNYMADGTKEGVTTLARAVGEGLGAGLAPGVATERRTCPACGNANDADARFCDGCGAALVKDQPCPDCGEPNDADAQFCDRCGRALES
jgi:predicted nucleic acid-binding Zn ribbon protein